jgi:hypothetical protein
VRGDQDGRGHRDDHADGERGESQRHTSDLTAEFTLEDQASIGPEGQLVLPKLFRRATDYLKAVGGGFRGNLADWLIAVSTSPSRDENDRVIVCGGIELHLSDLLVQANQKVRFQADLLDIVFMER